MPGCELASPSWMKTTLPKATKLPGKWKVAKEMTIAGGSEEVVGDWNKCPA